IITGETGAGKSIMLGALSLLMGKKADATVIRDSSRNCVVEGVFEMDGKDTILRRVINPAGRSRAFLNDEPMTLSDMAELSSSLIDIHEQHQSRFLDNAEYQLRLLDDFSANAGLMEAYSAVWNKYQERKKALSDLKDSIASASRDRDFRQFQYDRLSSASLREGELEELEEEQKILSNAETIMSELMNSENALENDSYSVTQSLKNAASSLSRIEKYLPASSELIRRLSEARIEIEDISSELDSMSETVTVSPQRLSQVEERLDTLYGLLKKNDVSSVAELIDIRDSLEKTLSSEEDDEFRLKELEEEVAVLQDEVRKTASELSICRRNASVRFSSELQECIRSLEMPDAVFEVSFTDKENPGPTGMDEVIYLFSANQGMNPGELSKVASGGELSRVMLSFKKVFSEYSSLPTMIFDEIDTGVSGRMADRMGKLIAGMGKTMQIFAITHLPQIASQNGTHFLIEKNSSDGESRTEIRRLSGDERVLEVARMLSGDTLSDAALENARTLINENKRQLIIKLLLCDL
ncbi:MAG: DNA repair protein RecN, partial [Alistipes sp.]|nr:DNA repair protein RecN [Candidatus Minthomonas equi]